MLLQVEMVVTLSPAVVAVAVATAALQSAQTPPQAVAAAALLPQAQPLPAAALPSPLTPFPAAAALLAPLPAAVTATKPAALAAARKAVPVAATRGLLQAPKTQPLGLTVCEARGRACQMKRSKRDCQGQCRSLVLSLVVPALSSRYGMAAMTDSVACSTAVVPDIECIRVVYQSTKPFISHLVTWTEHLADELLKRYLDRVDQTCGQSSLSMSVHCLVNQLPGLCQSKGVEMYLSSRDGIEQWHMSTGPPVNLYDAALYTVPDMPSATVFCAGICGCNAAVCKQHRAQAPAVDTCPGTRALAALDPAWPCVRSHSSYLCQQQWSTQSCILPHPGYYHAFHDTAQTLQPLASKWFNMRVVLSAACNILRSILSLHIPVHSQ